MQDACNFWRFISSKTYLLKVPVAVGVDEKEELVFYYPIDEPLKPNLPLCVAHGESLNASRPSRDLAGSSSTSETERHEPRDAQVCTQFARGPTKPSRRVYRINSSNKCAQADRLSHKRRRARRNELREATFFFACLGGPSDSPKNAESGQPPVESLQRRRSRTGLVLALGYNIVMRSEFAPSMTRLHDAAASKIVKEDGGGTRTTD